MTPFQVIPAIDLLDGQVVRLTQGDYGQVETYARSAADVAKWYQDHGAQRIHVVDLNGAKDGRLVNETCIKQIRQAVSCELELGGGIRTLEGANILFDLGIDFLVLGSLLIKNPVLARQISQAFPQKCIAGIDAKGQFVATEGWLETGSVTIEHLFNEIKLWPLAAVIYTDISKDGTLSGLNLGLLQEVAALSPFPLVASGGVGTVEHLLTVRSLNAPNVVGIVVGKALLSGKVPITVLRGF